MYSSDDVSDEIVRMYSTAVLTAIDWSDSEQCMYTEGENCDVDQWKPAGFVSEILESRASRQVGELE